MKGVWKKTRLTRFSAKIEEQVASAFRFKPFALAAWALKGSKLVHQINEGNLTSGYSVPLLQTSQVQGTVLAA